MKTVFLIGNGFDVNIGLPTKYSDFYNHYLGLDRINASESVLKLKKHLSKNKVSYWSDLEEALGNYTTELSSYEELEIVYDDINDEMQKYIISIDKSKLQTNINADLLKNNLYKPEDFLTQADKNDIESLYNRISTDKHYIYIINFNYTSTIEKILEFSSKHLTLGKATYHSGYPVILEQIYHVHGDTKHPIMGINDESQIRNESLRKNVNVQDYLIKPRINSSVGHLIDKQAFQQIKQANLICIYGLSLGITDSIWWKAIGERVLNGVKVILYVYDDKVDDLPFRKDAKYKREWKQTFCKAANIPESQRNDVMNNIIVAPNTPIFDIVKLD